MNKYANISIESREMQLEPDVRKLYEDLLRRAKRHADRHLGDLQAFEVAHDIVVELLCRPAEPVSETLLYLRVTSRIISMRRAADKRASRDRSYFDMRPRTASGWTHPGAQLEAADLYARIEETLSQMPAGMREIFLLVRAEQLSYKEAAARLGISPATVHTQLSRANALLRECVARYEAGVPRSSRGKGS